MQQERKQFVGTRKWNGRSVGNCCRRWINDTQCIPPFLAKRPTKSPLSTRYLPGLLASTSVRGSTSKVLASAKTIALAMYPLLGIRVRVKHISKIPSTLRNQASIEIHAAQ
jgi:hypothetical protein